MNTSSPIERKELFGHPAGLFVLFFTEMWERFSYYGMRGILTLYIAASASAADPGLGWNSKDALWLYGWYTMLVYVASIPDRKSTRLNYSHVAISSAVFCFRKQTSRYY